MNLNRIDITQVKRFGIVSSAILFVYGAVFFFKNREGYHSFYILSALLLSVSVLLPQSVIPLYSGLRAFGKALSWLMTRLILIVVFYFVVTPIGFCMRFFKKDFLKLSFKEGPDTYWTNNTLKVKEKESYERQF